jgi:hypothetical protein
MVREPIEFDRTACAQDAVVESLCGTTARGETACPDTADAIDVKLEQLHVTSVWDVADVRRQFVFDPHATDGYLATLTGEGSELLDRCCFSTCSPLVVGQPQAPLQPPKPGMTRGRRCVPVPPSGTSMPAAADARCPTGVKFAGVLAPFESSTADECCYRVHYHQVIRGRPARIEGEPAFAHVGEGDAEGEWHAYVEPDVVGATPERRWRIAAAWLEAARMEHASIAAFSNLSLRLLALGAPPRLLAATHAAALDEIEHARIAFALASRYAGRPLAPMEFADLGRMSTAGGLRALALETFVDGCIGETVAAIEADRAAALATDPVIVRALHRIASDELRHAELAWAIVRWCVECEPGLRGELRARLAAVATLPVEPRDEDLAAHGVLGECARAAIHGEVVRDVVAPCLAALAA